MSRLKTILSLVLLTIAAIGVSCGSDAETVAPPEAAGPRPTGPAPARAPVRTEAPAPDLDTLFRMEAEKRRPKAEWLESVRKASEQNKKKNEEK